MATNLYYHFDSEGYSELLYKVFSDRDISDEAINKLLIEVENTTNNVLSFEDEVSNDYERITCLSDDDNHEMSELLSNPFLDVYFVNGSFDSVIEGKDISASEVCFNLVEKNNNGFAKLDEEGLGNTCIFVIDTRELATIFTKRNSNVVSFSDEYMYGYYDQESKSIVKNLNYKARHSFDENRDVCYENYLGELDIPVYSENPIVNELYKKLYSLEVVFGKYVDESGFEDLKNQIKYYASSIVSLKNNISEDMVLGEANMDQDYEKEFAI
jgi:hypothetical protein